MSDRSVFSKYDLAVRKIIKHNLDLCSLLEELKDRNYSCNSKELRCLQLKIESHRKAINKNYVKCDRYDKIIKRYGTFYRGDVFGLILTQILNITECEVFRFVIIPNEDGYQGVIIRAFDGEIVVKLPPVLGDGTNTIACYGETYEINNACLQINFGDYPYLRDYLNLVVQHRYINDIDDDYDEVRMEKCYLTCFQEFVQGNNDYIRRKYANIDKEFLVEDCDIFLLQRVN